MKVIYVAAPFTAPTPRGIELNIRFAEEVGYEVARLGASALVPHSNGRFMVGTHTPEYWYEATAAQLLRCDAVLFSGAWESSRGCRGEEDAAAAHGIPCFYSAAQLGRWLAGTP